MQVSTSQPIQWFCFLMLVTGCTGPQLKPERMASEPVTLTLKSRGPSGEDITRYYSHSRIHDFEEVQLVRERDEIVEFAVSEKITKLDSDHRLTVATTTIRKDGTVDLHDLAFPEKGEEIEYIFGRDGEVFKAGSYPPDSVFFVPPVPLPPGPVEVGDTWTMDHAWVGMKNGIPLGLHLVAILKDLYRCGKNRCADVEISGQVEVIGVTVKKAQFHSTLWGRLMFNVENGIVLWSEVRSKERMSVPGARTEVLSCMLAELERPQELRWPGVKKACAPSEEAIQGLSTVLKNSP